jgi:hypothetical protein
MGGRPAGAAPAAIRAGGRPPGNRACRLYSHRPGGRVRGLRGWRLWRFRPGLADGGQPRPRRMRGPALCACPRVPAIPTEVRASTAAIGHHPASGQANTAQPARSDRGLFSTRYGRSMLVSHDLPLKSLNANRGRCAMAGFSLARPDRVRSGTRSTAACSAIGPRGRLSETSGTIPPDPHA